MPIPVKPPAGEAAASRRAAVRAFDALCREGPLTRARLVDALGASPSTITVAVKELQLRGFVAETGSGASTGGRRATILDLAPSLGSVLAIDVGAINVRLAAADVAGRILVRRAFPTPATDGPSRLRQALVGALEEVADAAPGPVLAITLAVAGIVDATTRRVSLATVPGWPCGDPAVWLEGFGAPVLVENEANLGALGERAQGVARDAGDVLFVALGAGIGAGIIIGGSLYRGATGSAGEIGLLRRSVSSPPWELEQEAAAAALVRRYREAGGTAAAGTAEAVFARAADGEAAARVAVAAVVDELAVGIANAIIVLDPELVVLGGGLGAAGSALLEPLRERIAPLVPAMPKLLASELGPEAALVGATAWAAEEARRRLRARLEDGRG